MSKSNFTNKQLEELLSAFNKDHIKLVMWLYKKHNKIWRQYEDECLNGLHLGILGEHK